MIGITERGDAALDHSWATWKGPKILITKAPNKLPLELIDPSNTIIHCTITGFGGSVIEPNVPKPEEALAAYRQLSEKYHTVLRVDPIIPTEVGVEKALNVAANAISRIRISFIDMYPHVKQRFAEYGLLYRIGWQTFHAPIGSRFLVLEKLQKLLSNKNIEIEICGEPDMKCTGCISRKDLDFFGISANSESTGFQRKNCACLSVKKELLSNKKQCAHGCLYCYWKG